MDVKRIQTREELRRLTGELGVSPDWHEPDEQDVTGLVFGQLLDNAGYWGDKANQYKEYEELHITLYKDGNAVASVNLATLLAWACEEN